MLKKMYFRNKAKQGASKECFLDCLTEVDGDVKIDLVDLISNCGEDNWGSISDEERAKEEIECLLDDNDFYKMSILSKKLCEVDFDKQIIIIRSGYYEIEDKYVDSFIINDYEYWVEEIKEDEE